MMRTWQLQEAKNKFSEVVEGALKGQPQFITKRGVEVAVLVSCADYRKLTVSRQTLSTFFRESPLVGVDLDLRRDTSGMRTEAIR